MNWNSWADFIHMGGYGLYVWGSLSVMVAAMVLEVWQIATRSRNVRSPGFSGADGEGGHEGEN